MEALLKNLKTATFNSMERMFFLLADPEEETNTDISGEVTVHIGITGEPAYLVTVAIGERLGRRMAGDLLGDDQAGIDHDTIVKCLQETANVIAGRFLLLSGDNAGRSLTLPAVNRDSVFSGRNYSRLGEFALSFDGCGMRVLLDETGG